MTDINYGFTIVNFDLLKSTRSHTCSQIYKSTAAVALLVRMTALIMACIAGAPLIGVKAKNIGIFYSMVRQSSIYDCTTKMYLHTMT